MTSFQNQSHFVFDSFSRAQNPVKTSLLQDVSRWIELLVEFQDLLPTEPKILAENLAATNHLTNPTVSAWPRTSMGRVRAVKIYPVTWKDLGVLLPRFSLVLAGSIATLGDLKLTMVFPLTTATSL